jgi:hypothetical protein
LFVEQQKNARIDIKVYNTLMQQQYSSTNYTEGSEIKEIKLAIVPKLKPGIYIVHIQVNKKHFWLEVIKE